MRVRHPNAVAGERVDVNGTLVPVEDGEFEVPEDERGWLRRWCDANDVEPDDVVVDEPDEPDEPDESEADDESGPEYCQAVKSDGEVCGRERPCRYHDD